MIENRFARIPLAALLALCMIPLGAFDWPEIEQEENPRNLRILLRTGEASIEEFSGLISGSRVLRIHEGLPLALGAISIFDYQSLFYGVGYEIAPDTWAHSLYDGSNRSKISHYSLLPQRADLQSPRVFDVRALVADIETSLVTWRNNPLPSGSIDLRLILADVPQGSIISGIESLRVSVAGETQFYLAPGVLQETIEGLRGRRQGVVEVLNDQGASLGEEDRLVIQGTVNIPSGRSVLRLGVIDYEGNENILSFVLIGTEGVAR